MGVSATTRGETPGTARGRRARAWAVLAVFALAITASLVFVNTLASRHRMRLDATQTGEHLLGPRATELLARLEPGYRVVLATDESAVDTRVLDRVGDVLDAFGRSTPALRVDRIDLGSASGVAAAARLTAELARREGPAIAEHAEAMTAALDEMEAAAVELSRLSEALLSVRAALPEGETTNRAYFEQRASIARVQGRDLGEVAAQMRARLDAGGASGTIADQADGAGLAEREALREPAAAALEAVREQTAALADDLGRFVAASTQAENARLAARPAATLAADLRDRLSVRLDAVRRLPALDAGRVARALSTGETLLVVGPPGRGVTAVDLEALLPGAEALDRAGVGVAGFVGPRAEQLLASAIGTLANPAPPIVVLTHAEAGEGVLGLPVFEGLRRRLSLRGVELLEWNAALEPAPPATTGIDPGGRRPVVHLVLSPDSAAGSAGDSALTGSQRAAKLGEAVARLLDEPRAVLVCLSPSVATSYGDADPIAGPLSALGIGALSGTPLLGVERTAAGVRTRTDLRLVPRPEGDAGGVGAALSGAVRGLPTVLPWAVPLRVSSVEGVRTGVVLEAPPEAEMWAESQWLRLWGLRREQRDAAGLVPAFDAARDHRWEGAWRLAVAAESSDGTRALVVGSNAWVMDPFSEATAALVDGRVVRANPGNGELLEAAVFWLAGQDGLVQPSVEARPIATVKPLSARQVSALRWALLAGLPGAVLGLGVVWRLVGG